MNRPGTPDNPLRVAVIGAGPAGFYAVQALLKSDVNTRIDLFDSLPTPFGLVRHGVAPDHQKIKSVVAVYHKLASDPSVRFFGNVEYGVHITLAELQQHYHQIVFSTGAQTDRRLGIPGEDLRGSHPATEFVAWYNGHPDFSDRRFDLSRRAAVVIGVGNVAVDVARILCRTTDELAATDIADPALEALRRSKIEDVYLVGRRGPAQAAFTVPEVKELGELAGAAALCRADEMELDPVSAEQTTADRATSRKVEILRSFCDRKPDGMARRLHIRFLASPVELIDDGSGAVSQVRLEQNELVATEGGALRSRGTGRFTTLDAGLVFRSVGYRGVPLRDLPFRDDWGIIPNELGRVQDPATGDTLPGTYVSGWIKRGPSGVIGTNKPDAFETVGCMLEDLQQGLCLEPAHPEAEAIDALLDRCDTTVVRYADWLKIDAREVEAGAAQGRPRVKFTNRDGFLEVLSG